MFNISKKYIISSIIFVVFILVGIFFLNKKDTTEQKFAIVKEGNIEQTVSVTGTVEPVSKVDLAFELSGKILKEYVDVGDEVYKGQKLLILNNSQYLAQYNQAKANLDVEESKLDELKKGTREEEILVQEVKVQNANQSFSDAKNNLVNKIKDAYTKSDDAIRNQGDQLFDNPRSVSPSLKFNAGFEEKNEAESDRLAMENLLNDWSESVDGLSIDNLDLYYNEAKNNLGELDSFLNELAFIVNDLSADSNTTQTTIDGYKSDIYTARSNINKAISNLTDANEKLETAESNLLLQEQTLSLKKSGATDEQIKIQEAKVKSAQANVNNYLSLIQKTIIYSPINGIITRKDVEEGEIVNANQKIISIISNKNFKIEADIPEVDIVKVKIGDIADITLDAYNDDLVFKAKVIKIDPAETVIDGISTYNTTLQFIEKDERVRSGMTANIDIITDRREGVKILPQRAVYIGENGSRYVKILGEDGIEEKRDIKIGLISSVGEVEVIDGLDVGDSVLVN